MGRPGIQVTGTPIAADLSAPGITEVIRARLCAAHGLAFEAAGHATDWPTIVARIAALDTVLTAAGLPAGAALALPGRNDAASVSLCLGLVATARCAAIVNPFQPAAAMVDSARATAPDAWLIDEASLDQAAFHPDDTVFVYDKRGAVRRHAPGRQARHAAADPQRRLILSTSGTTGEPKRVAIGDVALARAITDIIRFNDGFGDTPRADGGWAPLIQYSPLAHIGGALTLLRAAAQGRATVLLDKFDPHIWADAVARHRPATTGLPPAMMRMVLAADIPVGALASLKSVWSGSAPVKVETTSRFTERYGVPVLGNYGATEFCGAIAAWSLADHRRYGQTRAGAVGRIDPAVAEARVRDLAGDAVLPLGDRGALEVRVPRMGGGWVRTTDLAHVDGDGFLYLHGRSDDAIVRGGFKLAPDVIAAALRGHPAVRDAAVIGIDDPRLGQVPAAAVERVVGREVGQGDLIAEVRRRLPAYFAPVVIRFVDAIPRTPAMKIDRRALRGLFDPMSDL